MKISYCSLGCKVNLYESEAIVNKFVENGFEFASFDDICDVYIINTCTVTSTSDSKSKKIVRQAVKRNPNAVIAVMGCSSQLLTKEYADIEGVDIVIGTSNRHLLYDLVLEKIKNKNNNALIYNTPYQDILDYEEIKVNHYNQRTRGFVKIQDGCNNFCSYCIIPYARGPIRSRKAQDVIDEIALLTNQGMKEIILTGINTGTYGEDIPNYNLARLLKDIIDNVKGLGRIRISSIEATEITDELLQVMMDNQKHLCKHLHIPLQGGCDNTLERMNRKYNIDYYYQKIQKIRQFFPDINITTDILAGFSGETNEDFQASYDFIKKVGYGELHVFPYSPRPLTKAYSFKNRIDPITKKFRVNELLALNKELALNYRMKFLNKELEVLIEKNVNGKAYGHSDNYLEVVINNCQLQNNDLVKVRIDKVDYPICIGSVIDVQ